jgi:hypothetical protein
VADGDTDRATTIIENIFELHWESVVTADHQLATSYYSAEATVSSGLSQRFSIGASVES